MLRRLGVLSGAVLASLAFAASAHAAPSAPTIKPFSAFVCGSSLNMSWAASTPDPGGVIVQYRVDVGDLTAGTAGWKWVNGLNTTIGGLITNHHYVVRVRALQFKSGVLTWSPTAARTFQRTCLIITPERQYVAYNPWQGCIMCDQFAGLDIEDPIVYREVSASTLPDPERFRGMTLEADGSVLIG